MGRSIINSSPIEDKRVLSKEGFDKLCDNAEAFVDDPFVCPFGLEGYCEGIKDSGYYTRCAGHDFSFVNCILYNQFVNQPELYLYNQPDPSEKDTVIMHGDDIIQKKPYASIHDLIAEGVDVKKFYSCRKALRTAYIDERLI